MIGCNFLGEMLSLLVTLTFCHGRVKLASVKRNIDFHCLP